MPTSARSLLWNLGRKVLYLALVGLVEKDWGFAELISMPPRFTNQALSACCSALPVGKWVQSAPTLGKETCHSHFRNLRIEVGMVPLTASMRRCKSRSSDWQLKRATPKYAAHSPHLTPVRSSAWKERERKKHGQAPPASSRLEFAWR